METNQKSIYAVVGAIVVALAFVGGMRSVPTQTIEKTIVERSTDQPLGGERAGLQEFIDGAKLGIANSEFKGGTMGQLVNQANYRNVSGKTQYIDLATIQTTGTASTTFRFYVSTSSAATLNDYTAPTAAALINNFILATSSSATTTSSLTPGPHQGAYGLIPLANNEYVNFVMQNTFGQADCNGNLCETATSTARGFNINWMLRVITPYF